MTTLTGYVWLTLLVLVAVFELWASLTPGALTLSEWIWHMQARFAWLRVVVVAALAFLIYHFESR